MLRIPTACWLLLGSLGCLGCQPMPTPEVPTTREVSLTLTEGDQPLAEVRVALLPQRLRDRAGRLIPLAFGETDAQGHCRFQTADGIGRLTTGRYQVLISKPRPEQGRPPSWAKALIESSRGSATTSPLWMPDPADELSPYLNRHSSLSIEIEPGTEPATLKLDLRDGSR